MSTAQVVFENNIVRQPADPQQYDTSEGILKYFGEANNFPLKLAKLVQESPTASACISTLSDFIEGADFSDNALANLVINSQGLRFGDLHSGNSDAYALFEGVAILVKYNKQGQKTEFYPIPFENCRLDKPDSKGIISKIKVNPYFGVYSLFKNQNTKVYDTYNPKPEVVAAQIARDGRAYKGQILYIGKPRPLSPFYPRPHYMSCESWMGVDAGIGQYHKGNLDGGFFQSVLLKIIGNENDPSTHPDDQKWNETAQKNESKRTRGERFKIDMQQFLGTKAKSKGMVLFADNKDAMPVMEAFPSAATDNLFTSLQATCTENITRATKVPSILANIQSGATLGGDGNQIRAAVKVMQQRVSRTHAMFQRVYADLFSNSVFTVPADIKILHYNPFPELEVVDEQIWEVLTPEEKRNWIKKNTDIELLETAQPAAAPAVQPPAPPQDKFQNVLLTSYPQAAKDNAKRALKFFEDTGKACGTKAGWATSKNIADGLPISYESVKKIYRFLLKKESYKDYLFTDSCEAVLYSAWGGTEMKDWAANKITDTEK